MAEKELKDLKKEYTVVQKKYKLPSFEDLNLHFDIERLTGRETDFLLREIRRAMADKIYLYLKFCEMVISPSNAPLFMFSLIKNLTPGEKKKIEDLYKKLSQRDIEMMDLDLNYFEKKEAEFINNLFKDWKNVNADLNVIVTSFKSYTGKSSSGNSKAYFE